MGNSSRFPARILFITCPATYWPFIPWVAAQCCVLAWHSRGRVFEPRLLQQVLRFVPRIYTVEYVELTGYCKDGFGTAHEGGGATSQLDLPFLTPLSVAGCGRLQLGVPHWATSVDYCKLLNNWPHILR